MVALPHTTGDQLITDILYDRNSSLHLSIPSMLDTFIQRTLHNPANENLALTDLISNPTEIFSSETRASKRRELMSTHSLSYLLNTAGADLISDLHGYKGNYSNFSPRTNKTEPLYRLNLVTSLQPEGGVYPMGLQFGKIDAEQKLNRSAPINRDLNAEAHLAQQLADLFQVVASFRQPMLNS